MTSELLLSFLDESLGALNCVRHSHEGLSAVLVLSEVKGRLGVLVYKFHEVGQSASSLILDRLLLGKNNEILQATELSKKWRRLPFCCYWRRISCWEWWSQGSIRDLKRSRRRSSCQS